MKTTTSTPRLEWLTSRPANATHMIDDGSMIYYVVAPQADSQQVGDAFRVGYDGTLSAWDVTDLATGLQTDFAT